ncbi:ring-cleaving dioxygenase [Thermoflavimicrobium daqui]|jgi:glyoxalase family protein|uniref:Ring-cleaving dioxygenase n=1 Tax=Thermoflavimicrobium daqui TaxID=2137476 RepID=A0A364K1K5_9BACL|nr:ring-cleaving dioxygenase [Thermoflavimicrobium daqui]RAL21911.1 ring-cleaving dioxygenase [Thermoflavimicrobium daqui]
MANKATTGIHHITAIVGNPQENVDFYAGILGLRLVKKTVNFDDPGTYHLYFGNEGGQPGTIMTFFPWSGAYRGRIGTGQVGVTTFVVPENAFDFWEKRLTAFKVPFKTERRFSEDYLQFDDPHGLKLEIVARQQGPKSQWEFDGITQDEAIKGFGGAILLTASPYQTVELLEQVMGFEKIGEEGNYVRLRTKGDLGNVIDIRLTASPRGLMGVGTVHHIAWRAKDFEDHQEWRSHLEENGFHPTEILNRQYFNAIYFREPGGLLFEIATDPPGFDRDEPAEKMGEQLMLPPWLEVHREKIEEVLIPVTIRELKEDHS